MNCNTFLSLLDDYVDGAVSPDQQRQMEDHAKDCPHCRDQMTLLQDLRTLAQQDTVPESFAFAWRSRVRAEKRRTHPGLPVLASAAAVLLFLVGGTFWQRGQSSGVGSVMESAPLMRSMDAAPATFAMKAPEPTVWEYLTDFFRDMGQFALTALPVLAAAALLIFLLVRLKKHLKKERNEEK